MTVSSLCTITRAITARVDILNAPGRNKQNLGLGIVFFFFIEFFSYAKTLAVIWPVFRCEQIRL